MVQIFELQTRAILRQYKKNTGGHTKAVQAVAWGGSINGQATTLGSASDDNLVKLWDLGATTLSPEPQILAVERSQPTDSLPPLKLVAQVTKRPQRIPLKGTLIMHGVFAHWQATTGTCLCLGLTITRFAAGMRGLGDRPCSLTTVNL